MSTSVSLSKYENENVGSSEPVSCWIGGGVDGGVGALCGVKLRLVLVLSAEGNTLKADPEILENRESSLSCCGPWLGSLVQSDSISMGADPELSFLIVSGPEVSLAPISMILLVSTPSSPSLVILL